MGWKNSRLILTIVATTLLVLGWLATSLDDWSYNTSRMKDKCDPYAVPGFLEESDNPHLNRWIPFDTSCRSPALLASFAKAAWKIDPPRMEMPLGNGFVEADLGPDGHPWEDMSWAQNKTFLLVGDSIGRFALVDFCAMLGGVFEHVDPGHRWWPQGDESMNRGVDPIGHNANTCYIPSLDFLMLHTFNFGLDEEEYFAAREKHSSGPYRFEERFDFLASGIIDVLRKEGRESAPDVVFAHSGLWDASRWLRTDIQDGQDGKAPLSRERILWYTDRLLAADEHISQLWPTTPRAWASMHYPIEADSLGWFYSDIDASKQRPKNRLNRLYQMNSAIQHVVQEISTSDPYIRLFNWGEIVKGTERHMRDDLHPTMFPAYYVWADMVLYTMRDMLDPNSSRGVGR